MNASPHEPIAAPANDRRSALDRICAKLPENGIRSRGTSAARFLETANMKPYEVHQNSIGLDSPALLAQGLFIGRATLRKPPSDPAKWTQSYSFGVVEIQSATAVCLLQVSTRSGPGHRCEAGLFVATQEEIVACTGLDVETVLNTFYRNLLVPAFKASNEEAAHWGATLSEATRTLAENGVHL